MNVNVIDHQVRPASEAIDLDNRLNKPCKPPAAPSLTFQSDRELKEATGHVEYRTVIEVPLIPRALSLLLEHRVTEPHPVSSHLLTELCCRLRSESRPAHVHPVKSMEPILQTLWSR